MLDRCTLDECITSKARLNWWIAACKSAGVFGFDSETTGLQIITGDDTLTGFCLAVSPTHGCYIPVGHTTGEDQLEFDYVVDALKPILEDPKLTKVAHNFAFDFNVCARLGIEVRNYDDTMLMSYAYDGALHTARGHSFDALTKFHMDYDSIRFDDVVIPELGIKNFSDVRLLHATTYASEDARKTLELHGLLHEKLEREGLYEVYDVIDRPLARVVADAHRRGVLVNIPAVEAMNETFTDRVFELQEAINEAVGREVNPGSPKQLATLLYDDLKLTPPWNRDGKRKTDKDALDDLKGDHPVVDLLLEHSKYSTLVSNVTSAWPTLVCERTGRIHGQLRLTNTNTRRLAATDPNLQNVPVRTKEGKQIRNAVVAPVGRKLVVNDASQIEYRVLAHVAQCTPMIEAFRAGYDFHAATAADIFGGDWTDYTDETNAPKYALRSSMKNVNFANIYGAGPKKVARMCGIAEKEAYCILDEYKEKFPEVEEWKSHVKQFARRNGYVETLFGGRIHVPMVRLGDKALQAYGERQAINAVVQGTAADIVRIAMTEVWKALRRYRNAWLLLQVHDELIVECYDKDAEEIKELVKHIIETCTSDYIQWSVPLVSKGGIGQTWLAAK